MPADLGFTDPGPHRFGRTYPNATHRIGKKLSKLRSVTSSFDVTVPSSGAYTTACGIWDPNNRYEIMLWMNKTGPVGRLRSSQGTAPFGGSTWTVYKGSNGSNAVFSFVRVSNTSAGTADVLAMRDVTPAGRVHRPVGDRLPHQAVRDAQRVHEIDEGHALPCPPRGMRADERHVVVRDRTAAGQAVAERVDRLRHVGHHVGQQRFVREGGVAGNLCPHGLQSRLGQRLPLSGDDVGHLAEGGDLT
ncbi:hypothetical protein PV408_03295 [Streptomyces sp. ME18-1-4]|nr:hypothetical protein [Streptomyces sp. ME18-1-4]MDX3240883.1 hypothetical protein [Streptomyces sp. ME18-1-4]